jgi:integrase
MPLTDTAVRNAKPKEKPYKLGDSGGLYVIVRPNRAKWWRLKFRFGGKEKLLSFGVYPEVSLQEARRRRDEARELLANGVNPSHHRKVEHAVTGNGSPEETFEAVAGEWFPKQLPGWSEGHARTVRYRLSKFVYPAIGKRSMKSVTAQDLLALLKPVEEAEKYETARRVLNVCQQVCVYAIATGRIAHNPAASVTPALTQAPPAKHFAAMIDPKEIGPLLRMLDGYEGSPVVMSALRLAPLLFVRPGELRKAKWADIDLDATEPQWQFLVTKTHTDHIVPLATQAVAILRALHPHTGHQEYVFPGARNNGRPMSENAVLAAMRTLGIPKEKMTGHGFRAMAYTVLAEQLHFPQHLIDHQLAHVVRNTLGTAYNRTTHLPERRRMMQKWAGYLDELRSETEP